MNFYICQYIVNHISFNVKIGIKYVKGIVSIRGFTKNTLCYHIECLLLHDVILIAIVPSYLSYSYHILFLLYEQISYIPHMLSKIL